MAGERRLLAVSVLFLSLSALAATFQCCDFLLSLLLIWRACKCNMNSTPARRVTPPWFVYMAKWATRLGGLPHLSCKHDQIKMRDYMERRVTPLRRVTPPTWGPPPPCKQALIQNMCVCTFCAKFDTREGTPVITRPARWQTVGTENYWVWESKWHKCNKT